MIGQEIYRRLFARPGLQKFNRLLFNLSLNGLGIMNYRDDGASGERYFVTAVLPKLVRDAPVFMDVGANVGTFAALLHARFPAARIHAFEPHPKNFARLVGAVGGSTLVRCHNLAVGDSSGALTLYDRADSDGSSHASLHETVISELHGQGVVKVDVNVVTLDEFTRAESIDRVDYLKIDTEGHEFAALQGASAMLEAGRIGCVQFEFNEMNVVSRVFLRDFRKLLRGYQLFRFLPRGLLPLADTPLHTELFAYQNIVALRDGTYPLKVR